MPAAPDTRRRFLPWFFPALFLAGVWFAADPLMSALAARALGVPVRLSGVRPVSWNSVHFQSALVSDADARAWVSAGPGSVRWLPAEGGPLKTEVVVSDALLKPALFFAFLGRSASSSEVFSREFPVNKARLGIRSSGGKLELRLLRLDAEGLLAQGGFFWNGRSLETANLMLQLSPELLRGLPADWAARFPVDGRGHRILKCSFRKDRLTLFGRSGPLLRASWEMAYTTSP